MERLDLGRASARLRDRCGEHRGDARGRSRSSARPSWVRCLRARPRASSRRGIPPSAASAAAALYQAVDLVDGDGCPIVPDDRAFDFTGDLSQTPTRIVAARVREARRLPHRLRAEHDQGGAPADGDRTRSISTLAAFDAGLDEVERIYSSCRTSSSRTASSTWAAVSSGARTSRSKTAGSSRSATCAVRGEEIDCTRFAVVPGIVNAHNHSNENWFRGPLRQPPARAVDALFLPGAREPGAIGPGDLRAHAARRPGDDPLRSHLRRRLRLRARGLDRGVDRRGRARLPRSRPARGDRDRHVRPLLRRGGRARPRPGARRPARRFEPEKPPDWPEWETFSRFAVERYHRPEEGISIGLGPSGPAALHRRDAPGLRGACGRARPDHPHPRARNADAGALGDEDVRQDAARASAGARLSRAARQLRARHLADRGGHRPRRARRGRA